MYPCPNFQKNSVSMSYPCPYPCFLDKENHTIIDEKNNYFQGNGKEIKILPTFK